MLRTWITLVCLVVASLLWLVVFSRLRWRTRGVTLLAVLVVGAGLAASVRQRGVTGDLKPIFEWRWTKRAATLERRKTSAAVPTRSTAWSGRLPTIPRPRAAGASRRAGARARLAARAAGIALEACCWGRLVSICRGGSPRGDPGTTGRGRMCHVLRSHFRRTPLGTAYHRALRERTRWRRPPRHAHDRWRPMLHAGSNGASPMPGPRHWRGDLGGGHRGCRRGEGKSQDPRMGDERLAAASRATSSSPPGLRATRVALRRA